MELKSKIIILSVILIAACLLAAVFCIFFDEAVIVRKGTFYRGSPSSKVVALTFDDGPSPVWTPKILDELKRAGIKATFFMLGEHVAKYPDIAKRVAADGHEIENHSWDHHVLIYYKSEELYKQIKDTEKTILDVTGQTTTCFRPPKAWVTDKEKQKLKEMGYQVVLWSLNSKDWVTFDDKYMREYIVRNVRPGDIILFHDSGGVFGVEGGNRDETTRTIYRLTEKLREKGYGFVTIKELLGMDKKNNE